MSNNEDLQVPEENVDEAAVEAQDISPKESSLSFEQQVEALTEQLNQSHKESEALKDTAVRAKAESENVRRRAEREVSNASKYALEKFSKEILTVVDSLEKALETPPEDQGLKAMHEGVELTLKLLLDILEKFSIQRISPTGEQFNPELHEAMVMQESEEHEPNSVMHVVQMGYSLSGRLIRPARVIVSKGKSPEINQKA